MIHYNNGNITLISVQQLFVSMVLNIIVQVLGKHNVMIYYDLLTLGFRGQITVL